MNGGSSLNLLSAPDANERRARAWLALIGLLAAVAFPAIVSSPARSENAEIATRRAAERTSFTDAEIMNGFFKLAFRAELQLDRKVERIRKFDEPVRVSVINRGNPARQAQIAAIVGDIRARIVHLDIAITDDPHAANFFVMLVPQREFRRTVRSVYGRERAKQIHNRLAPQCLSGIGKDERYRIRRAEAILPVDADEFTFYDCAYEEILQGLGVINDDASVPWTMFNDDVQMGFFDVYDQYLLNILYDPRVRPGMNKEEVDKLTDDVLPTVRAWVSSTNPPHADGRAGSGVPTEVSPHSAVRSLPRRALAVPGRG